MASSLAACLHSVGFEMPHMHDVVPLLDVDVLWKALTECLQNTGSVSLYIQYITRAAPTQGIVSCTYEHCLSLTAHVGGIVSFLFLGGTCSDFCSLGWAVMACQLLLVGWLAPAM